MNAALCSPCAELKDITVVNDDLDIPQSRPVFKAFEIDRSRLINLTMLCIECFRAFQLFQHIEGMPFREILIGR
jgi:hypothetical protein